MSDKVQVLITVKRNTTYSSIVEMPRSEYDRISKKLDSDDYSTQSDGEVEANNLIDVDDCQYDELDQLMEFEIQKS